jgi:transcription elongation GreA/GreB family factor
LDWELAFSLESPIWQAIRGKKVGETAKMRHESGRKNIKILAIA